jgi:hypothetical protein
MLSKALLSGPLAQDGELKEVAVSGEKFPEYLTAKKINAGKTTPAYGALARKKREIGC